MTRSTIPIQPSAARGPWRTHRPWLALVLVAIVALRLLSAAWSLGAGSLHQHRDPAHGEQHDDPRVMLAWQQVGGTVDSAVGGGDGGGDGIPPHDHAFQERHHHLEGDPTVVDLDGDDSGSAGPGVLTDAWINTPGTPRGADARGQVRHAWREWAWVVAAPVVPTRPPQV